MQIDFIRLKSLEFDNEIWDIASSFLSGQLQIIKIRSSKFLWVLISLKKNPGYLKKKISFNFREFTFSRNGGSVFYSN